MGRLVFNRRLLQAIVALAHLMIVLLVGAFAYALTKDDSTWSRIGSIAPVQKNYDILGLAFIGHGRDIGHVIAFFCSLIIGSRLIKYGMTRMHEVTRFFAVSIGVQILFSAALNMVLVGLVWFGGWWHLLSLLVICLEAASMVVTTSIMVLYWDALVALGSKQDTMVGETTDHSDEAKHG